MARAGSTRGGYRRVMSWEDRSDRLEREGPELLWRQVAGDLRRGILSGEIPPGSRLPNEHELSSIYRVARVTVRSAISYLESEGLVVVTRGRGTYVRRR